MRRFWVFLAAVSLAGAVEHTQESDMTFRQVMQLVNQATISILQGFLFNNDYLIISGAQQIVHHPMPKGGPIRYIDPSRREEFIKAMPTFEEQVHGSAERLVKFIREGRREEAYEEYMKMVRGCMACHQMFRDFGKH
ncbi:hypothetical protein [Thermocrinis minervae]|uniref:Cytochrome C n=1 Tax=Thermocrinis minervae TaxID=381751 RepID=A0A1M6QQR7_9AQUI|nr:hypothetical protein [Thermocrinis minervae]SHK22601.1 hypothetical protein SAMN05444391_0350 [Thermocrinis minervae]